MAGRRSSMARWPEDERERGRCGAGWGGEKVREREESKAGEGSLGGAVVRAGV